MTEPISTELVFADETGEPFTTSLVIAEQTQNDHASVMRLIRDNRADFETFGIVGFEIRKSDGPGRPENYANLTEPQATLLLTYMRNSDVVKAFKVRLVRDFYAMRQMLAAAPRPLPTKKELAQWVVEAEERAEAAESKVRELTGPAEAWNELAEAAGDYSVADAAKVLSRDPKISTGERRLFAYMRAERLIYREGGRWRAYQSQVDNGRLTEKLGRPYLRDGVMHNGDPTVRITPKGLAELHKRMGGSGQLPMLAEVSA